MARPRPTPRRWGVLAAAGLLVVLGVGVGAWFLFGESTTAASTPSVRPPAADKRASVPPPGVPSEAPGSVPVPGSILASGAAADSAPRLVQSDEDRRLKEAALASAAATAPASAGSIKLTIDSDPQGASVREDDRDQPLGLTPLDVPLDGAGARNFSLKLAGYEPATLTADPKEAKDGVLILKTPLVKEGSAVAEARASRGPRHGGQRAAGGPASQPPAPTPSTAAAAPRPPPTAAPASAAPASAAPKQPKQPKQPKKPKLDDDDPYAE